MTRPVTRMLLSEALEVAERAIAERDQALLLLKRNDSDARLIVTLLANHPCVTEYQDPAVALEAARRMVARTWEHV